MAHTLDALRLAIGAGLLLFASVQDLKHRRVHNYVWVVGGLLGLILLLMDLLVTQRATWVDLGFVVLVIGVAYVLWWAHILAGGADAKALMMLAILLPVPISWDVGAVHYPLWTTPIPLPAALVVLANSVLAFALVPFLLFFYNLGRRDVHVPAMFLGYRMDLDQAAKSHVWIVERAHEDGRRSMVLWVSRLTPDAYEENVRRLRALGLRRVWTTPKIPFMVPLLLGFVAAFWYGDLLTHLVVQRIVPGGP